MPPLQGGSRDFKILQSYQILRIEQMDREDRVMMDVPLFIRILELVREDIKDDAGLHVVADAIINQSRGGDGRIWLTTKD